MGSVWKALLYGGLSKDQFESVKADIDVANLASLRLYASIGCVVFGVLVVASHISGGLVGSNWPVYLGSCIACAVIVIMALVLAKSHPRMVFPLTVVFSALLYAFAIGVSNLHPEYPAVSPIVFLMVVPLLFVNRPVFVMGTTSIAVLATCVASAMCKDAVIASDDIWNAVTFGIVAMASGFLVTRMRMRSLYQEQEIERLGTLDTLTGLKNRNRYEQEFESYAEVGADTIACVFIDVNGLHEMNNEHGHDAGDAMLRVVADDIRSTFDDSSFYRIGGDEFVGFVSDISASDLRGKLDGLCARLSDKDYSVSSGMSVGNPEDLDGMRSLVRSAEQHMYEDKRRYYASSGHDRRRRS